MKHVIVFLLYLFSAQSLFSEEILVNSQDGNDSLIKYDGSLQSKPDFLLLTIQQKPIIKYKPVLEELASSIFIEKPDPKLQKLCLMALMAYNDIWAYNCISYKIDYSKNYASVAKCFCDLYDENKNELYKPLRQKFEIPDFITDSFVLKKTNFNDFVDKWLNYSSVLMNKDKYNPLNKKIQDFYKWDGQRRYEEYLQNCFERDSLYSLNKRKNKERISILKDLISKYEDAEKKNKYILPRTIDVCYSSDSFAHHEEEYKLNPIFNEGCPRCRRDSQTVIVPDLKDFLKKEDSIVNGGVQVFLMDTHIKNLIGNYALESYGKHEQIVNLFNVEISFADYNKYIYPETIPIITNICSYSDGVLLNIRYVNSGYWAFFPNDENAQIKIFGHWVE